MRAHNNSGHPLPSTTKSTYTPSNTSATNDSSSTTNNRDALNTTASIPLNDTLNQNTVAPLFVPGQSVEYISADENEILMQLLLQRLPAIPTYETVPIQSPFSSPISVYQPTSNLPDYVKHALLQQINPGSTSLKSRALNAETIDPNRALPLPYSPTSRSPVATSNAVHETESIIAPDDITTLSSNIPTIPTVVEPIFELDKDFINTPTPNTLLKNSATSTHHTKQPSTFPCPECNSSSSTPNYA